LDVWTVPFIIVVLVICIISFIAVKKWNKVTVVVDGQDDQISGPIEEHPFTLNPIIWIVLVAVFFIGIVIFYYAASS
jgi:preprotein translocase subunit SecG